MVKKHHFVTKDISCLFLFLFIILFYFLHYGLVGYDDADSGYTLGIAWRIFNGEIPYKDIIMVRPPLSPFFHTLSLYLIPDNYQLIFERFIFYVLMGISSLMGSLSINKVFNEENNILHPYLLAILGFIFSVHNFPPLAWHTVDGIFFASIGVFLLVSGNNYFLIFSGILFLVLSALCKQPFYLMPICGIGYIICVSKNYKKTLFAISVLLLFAFIFLLTLYKSGSLASFFQQTTGLTTFSSLIDTGLLRYLQRNYSIYIVFTIAFWLILKRISPFGNKAFIPYIFITLLFINSSKLYLTTFSGALPTPTLDNISPALFIISVLVLLANFTLEKKWVTITFLIIISWCSSISWGYSTPVLFSLPLIYIFFFASEKYFSVKKPSQLASYFLCGGMIIYFIGYQRPYCNPPRNEIKYEISDIFPKLKGIKVSKYTYEKYHDLSYLINKYGNNFKTLPGMPLSNYLTNTISPVALDWVTNTETGGKNQEVILQLQSKNCIIFIEKEPQFIHITDKEGMENSLVAFHITRNWQLIERTKHFEVYSLK